MRVDQSTSYQPVYAESTHTSVNVSTRTFLCSEIRAGFDPKAQRRLLLPCVGRKISISVVLDNLLFINGF